jgi:HAD superfamily hydrolase (TIGR01549 family)
VLFDVDGTLVDTNYLHTLAWSRAFRDAGEWAPMNAIHRLVGMGGDQLVPRLLGHDSPAAVAARPQRYQELAGDIRPFPQAADLLRRVHGYGLAVVLATSAPHDELQILRKTLDADDAIEGQTTADDIGDSKPAPEVFLTAMQTSGVDARCALAVATASGTCKRLVPPASAASRSRPAGSVNTSSATPAPSRSTETSPSYSPSSTPAPLAQLLPAP